MNRAVAKRWVDALRSGNYEQGQGHLRQLTEDGPKDCCLGVLCDIAISDGVEIITRAKGHTVSFNGQLGTPPIDVMDWSGLTYDDSERYADMNDVQAATFADIADHIESTYLQEGGE